MRPEAGRHTGDRKVRARELSREELDALGVSTDLPTAGRAFGFDRDHAYDLAKRGQFPCPVIKVGRRYVVPTAGLRRSLGLDSTPEPQAS